jgi:hypothetical protein
LRRGRVRTLGCALSGRRRAGLRGTRRQGAEPAALACPQRLEWQQVPRRRYRVARLSHERRFARDLANAFAVAEIVRPQHDSARQIGGAGQHARSHVKGRNGPAVGGRDIGRRDARIDRKPAILQYNGPVDDSGFADEDLAISPRQDDLDDARSDEITFAYENPKLRPFAIFDNHLVGR